MTWDYDDEPDTPDTSGEDALAFEVSLILARAEDSNDHDTYDEALRVLQGNDPAEMRRFLKAHP